MRKNNYHKNKKKNKIQKIMDRWARRFARNFLKPNPLFVKLIQGPGLGPISGGTALQEILIYDELGRWTGED